MIDRHDASNYLDSYGTVADSRDEGKELTLPTNSLVLLSDIHTILRGATEEEIASIIETNELPIYRHIKTVRNDKNEEITIFKDINEYVSYDMMRESPNGYVAKSEDFEKLMEKHADYFFELVQHNDERMIPAKLVRERVTALETENADLHRVISVLKEYSSNDIRGKKKSTFLQVISAFLYKMDIDISEENHNRVTTINRIITNNHGTPLNADTIRSLCKEVEIFRRNWRQ